MQPILDSHGLEEVRSRCRNRALLFGLRLNIDLKCRTSTVAKARDFLSADRPSGSGLVAAGPEVVWSRAEALCAHDRATTKGEFIMVAVGVGHVAIGVSDIERSIEFYRDVVGFDVYLDRLEAMPLVNRDRRAVYMRNQHEPYSTFIVLDAEVGAEPFGEVNRLWGLGVHHFAFWTTDVEDATGKARAKGHEIVVGPVDADSIAWAEPAGTTIRTVLMKDPDGNIVQLVERCS